MVTIKYFDDWMVRRMKRTAQMIICQNCYKADYDSFNFGIKNDKHGEQFFMVTRSILFTTMMMFLITTMKNLDIVMTIAMICVILKLFTMVYIMRKYGLVDHDVWNEETVVC